MSKQTFKCLWVEEGEDRTFTRGIITRNLDDLPEGDLVVKVHYSSLNYKDALSATGNKGVTRTFPHTPGIDAAGEVVQCNCGVFSPGDSVIVTGFDLGMNTPGGFGEFIRIPCEWALKLPGGLTLAESMALGTAGFTAGLCVQKLVDGGVEPGDGEIIVTGATGGVGSIAVSILHQAGYRVAAVTGKETEADFLRSLGADKVLTRQEVTDDSGRPMLKEHWAGAVDVVGGDMLSTIIRATRYGGVVTCCGLVGSPDLPVNVFPFILRGVSLMGVDSVQVPMADRLPVWDKLAGPWKPAHLMDTVTECSLEELDSRIDAILKGQLKGRTVVNLST